MIDVMECGEYLVRYRAEIQEGRLVCTEVLDYVQNGNSVPKAQIEKDYVLIEEYDIQAELDDQASEGAG